MRATHARLAPGVCGSRRAPSVLAVVAMIVLTLAVAPLRTLLDQRSGTVTARTAGRTARLRTTREFEARIGELNDPAYLERLARECLGMVKPGETAFVVDPHAREHRPLPV